MKFNFTKIYKLISCFTQNKCTVTNDEYFLRVRTIGKGSESYDE